MATIIDPESAKSLMEEYKQQNSASGGPAIKTHEGHFLNGYFLDRESLEEILSNPKAVGVSLHLAKHPAFKGKAGNHFTLVYGGAEKNTDVKPVTPLIHSGAYYSDPPPCPPMCNK